MQTPVDREKFRRILSGLMVRQPYPVKRREAVIDTIMAHCTHAEEAAMVKTHEYYQPIITELEAELKIWTDSGPDVRPIPNFKKDYHQP